MTASVDSAGAGLDAAVPGSVYLAALALYARQGRMIDTGRAAEWAATFTVDGVFASPSYPAPLRGTAELVAFVERATAQAMHSGDVIRHVLTNVDVHETAEPGRYVSDAYLQIVATATDGPSRLVRMTTVHDQLEATPDGLRISHRQVRRDDAGPLEVLHEVPKIKGETR